MSEPEENVVLSDRQSVRLFHLGIEALNDVVVGMEESLPGAELELIE